MQAKKSIEAGKSDGAAKAEQNSRDSQGIAPGRRINVEMAHNLLLIWLDKNIDDNSVDRRNSITQLRCIVNRINTFTDTDKCVEFLGDTFPENVCTIIPGALCQKLVPLIHDVVQLHAIFILSENNTGHEKWTSD